MNTGENNTISFALPEPFPCAYENDSRYYKKNKQSIMFDDLPLKYPKQKVMSFQRLCEED